MHVTDNTGEGYVASDIPITIQGNNQSPDSFQGSETGTFIKLGFGSYAVVYSDHHYKNPSFPPQIIGGGNQGCFGVIHPDETKTCTITLTIEP